MREKVDAWYMHRVRYKPNKVVVRLYRDNDTFLDGINIPTVMWPLNASYEAFHYNNCELIEDQIVADVVDSVHYRIGHCYANAKEVTEKLIEKGYNAKQYVGWLFVNGNQYPIHHSWTVLNGIHVIDLADEFSVLDYNRDKFQNTSEEDGRKLLVQFSKWVRNFPNSKRCMPFGVPTARLLYIGCECSREQGINIYNDLNQKYPNHPCRERVQANNMTRMQEMLAAEGIT